MPTQEQYGAHTRLTERLARAQTEPYVFIDPGGFGSLHAFWVALVFDEVDTRNMNLNENGTRFGPMVSAGIRAGR